MIAIKSYLELGSSPLPDRVFEGDRVVLVLTSGRELVGRIDRIAHHGLYIKRDDGPYVDYCKAQKIDLLRKEKAPQG